MPVLAALEEREGLVTPDFEHPLTAGEGPGFSLPNQPPTGSPARRDHSLGLAPGDGIHAAVGQEVRAVPDLHVDDAFFCFRFDELIGDPPHRLAVTPAGMAAGPITLA